MYVLYDVTGTAIFGNRNSHFLLNKAFEIVLDAFRHVETQTKFDRSSKGGKKHFVSAIEVHQVSVF